MTQRPDREPQSPATGLERLPDRLHLEHLVGEGALAMLAWARATKGELEIPGGIACGQCPHLGGLAIAADPPLRLARILVGPPRLARCPRARRPRAGPQHSP